ncbi:MAG TPA: hypothetical protein VNL94_07510 [Candidatus Binatia bacterium]|nr:hypothetical protein [Candidatus Binatia bacterium]
MTRSIPGSTSGSTPASTPISPPGFTPGSTDRVALLRRLVVANVIVFALILSLQPYVERFWELRVANDWGSDWKWLQDGLERLAAGLPLTRPEMVAGPWSQFPPPNHAPTYDWSLHPPYSATAYAPFMLAPAEFRNVTWAVAMIAVLVAAVWLAWPRRLWWGTGLLLLTGLFWLPDLGGAWPGIVDQIHYANPNALVILGLVLVWLGRKRDSVAIMAAGLVLAALKIAPAATLGAWLLVAREGAWATRRAILAAAVVLGVMSIPILFLDPGAVSDMIRSQLNLEPWTGRSNLAPLVRLAPLIGEQSATLLSYGIAAALMLVVLSWRLDGPGGFLIAVTAPLLATPQLWAHWFLLPAIAFFATAQEWRLVRAIDRWLEGSAEPAQRPGPRVDGQARAPASTAGPGALAASDSARDPA